MLLPPILALLEHPGDAIYDEMLRLLGIAAIVWVLFKGIKSLLSKPGTAQTAVSPKTSTPTAGSAPGTSTEALNPEILAVIAAAVASVCGSNRRVVTIRSLNPSWEMSGRQSILTSHRIR
jgi:threonine/homoserine/homoserine lactone efflux protein